MDWIIQEEASQMIEKAQFLISSTFDFAVQKNVGQVHVSAWHGFPLKSNRIF